LRMSIGDQEGREEDQSGTQHTSSGEHGRNSISCQ